MWYWLRPSAVKKILLFLVPTYESCFVKEAEETPAKKSRHGKEPYVTHSPSLRQGKQGGESSPRVIFTGLVDKQREKV